MSAIKIYGIRECDTCRKAVMWLNEQGHDHEFHDLRRDGLDRTMLERWTQMLSLNDLVNRRSRTWRELPETDRQNMGVDLIIRHPTLVKRPVLEQNGVAKSVGFRAEQWKEML